MHHKLLASCDKGEIGHSLAWRTAVHLHGVLQILNGSLKAFQSFFGHV
eukprot:COSAG02_NODE_7926_length_2784_cov_1.108752_3_plen_48_part_00